MLIIIQAVIFILNLKLNLTPFDFLMLRISQTLTLHLDRYIYFIIPVFIIITSKIKLTAKLITSFLAQLIPTTWNEDSTLFFLVALPLVFL